nr:hypothetical protein [Tanacetum cinerariifolium]
MELIKGLQLAFTYVNLKKASFGNPHVGMEPQLNLYVRLGEMLGLGYLTIGRRYEKGGIVAIVEGDAHGGFGLRRGLLGVQTQSHIGRIIISKLTYKLDGLLLLSSIGFEMKPQLGLYVRGRTDSNGLWKVKKPGPQTISNWFKIKKFDKERLAISDVPFKNA